MKTWRSTLTTWVVVSSLFLLLLGACSVMPPVQEMSDARQAIKAAREANAEQYAPQKLRSAEDSLDLATKTLEQGEYEEARMAASVAKALAIKARDAAVAAAASQ
jgi:Sec-independent protein translocase protein TatA